MSSKPAPASLLTSHFSLPELEIPVTHTQQCKIYTDALTEVSALLFLLRFVI